MRVQAGSARRQARSWALRDCGPAAAPGLQAAPVHVRRHASRPERTLTRLRYTRDGPDMYLAMQPAPTTGPYRAEPGTRSTGSTRQVTTSARKAQTRRWPDHPERAHPAPGRRHASPGRHPGHQCTPFPVTSPRETGRATYAGKCTLSPAANVKPHTGLHGLLSVARPCPRPPSVAVRGKPTVPPTVLAARTRPLYVRGHRDTPTRGATR